MSEDLETLRCVDFDIPSSADAWDIAAPRPTDPKPTLEVPGDDRLISTFAN